MSYKMKNNFGKKVSASLLAIIMVLTSVSTIIFVAAPVKAADSTIWTADEYGNPKGDFSPGDVVYIHGSGFNAGSTMNIAVTRPDGSVDNAPGGQFPDELPVVETDGTFVYTYDLDGIPGTYTIDANDGEHFAQTTFTDQAPVVTYRDSGYSNQIAVFHPGDTVYALIAGTSLPDSKFIWRDPNDIIVNQSSDWLTGGGPFTDSYLLPSDAEIGRWTVTRFLRRAPGGPYENVTTNFYVIESNKFIPDDSSVSQNNPGTNYGDNSELHARYQAGQQRWSYLKFNLSSIPTGACIFSGDFYLYSNSGSTSTPRPLGVYNVTDDSWTENGITWNNRPAPGSQINSTSVGRDEWVSWNLTTQIQSEINAGGDKILSVVLYFPTSDPDNFKRFWSTEENTQSTYQGPYLEIGYDVTPPIVTAEIGEPKIYVPSPHDKYLIGPNTPVWLNASDPGGSGASWIWYTVNPGYTVTVYDNQAGDEDDTLGVISVRLTFHESCWHQIDYSAGDDCGHYTGIKAIDFYVDADPPQTTTFLCQPYIPITGPPENWSWIGNCTYKWINATDTGCLPGGSGVKNLTVEVATNITGSWVIQYTTTTADNNVTTMFPDLDPTVGKISIKVHINNSCWHWIKHWAYDNLGTQEDTSTMHNKQVYKVDATPPTSNIIILGTCVYTNQGIYIRPQNEINITTDNVGTNPCIYPVTMRFWRVYVGAENRWYPDPITGQGSYDGYGPADSIIPAGKTIYWYTYDNSRLIHFTEECKHYLEYFSKDPLCNTEATHNITFFVDDTLPRVYLNVSGHGFYRDPASGREYLKCGKSFYINATDNDTCPSGIEAIFWRYNYSGVEYPSGPGPDIQNGTKLVELYGEEYNIPAITNYYWYRVNDTSKEISFDNECRHNVTYFAKDNVCHHTDVYTRTFYVDCALPTVHLDVSGHGYYIDPTSGYQYLKAGKNFWINATDSGVCQAGIESIFWRYEYDCAYYPPTPGWVTDPVVHGADLVNLYGDAYAIPEVTGYDWYQYNGSHKMINFPEQCVHTVYYFAKDNVCHPNFGTGQGIVWDNGETTPSSSAWSSQKDTCYPFVSQVADDFQFTETTEITDVHWYGTFWMGPPDEVDPCPFWIYFYADDGTGNAPTGGGMLDPSSTALASYYFPAVTGYPKDANNFYSYEVNLSSPFTALGGQKYWIAIQSVFCFPPQWGWATTAGITYGSSALGFPLLGYPFWTPLGIDTAFYLTTGSSIPFSRTFYVDATPPTTNIQFPDHGYKRIDDTSGYLKCFTNFTISADDTGPCQAGLEYLLWRYVYDGDEYPTGPGQDVITGAYLASHYGYTDAAYIGHDWYYTTDPTKTLQFSEECNHTFYYWAKDNVCHNSTMKTHTFYVDNSGPNVTFIPPTHGYYPTDATSGYLKCYTNFTLNATDLPANDCHAGIESIFWRYEYNGDKYPPTQRPIPDPTDSIVDGKDLVTLYGPAYDIPEITGYCWYRYDGSNKIINFTEQCKHTIYYFAKDNVCNPSYITAQGIVWNNGETTPSSMGWSSQDSTCPPAWTSQVADDFIFNADTTINDVHWYGEFWNGVPFNPVDFKIYIYADDGTGNAPTGSGMPDPSSTALASYFLPGVTGLPKDANGKYSYSANLNPPFVCLAHQKYWIAIQSVFCSPTQWGWTNTSGITYGSSAQGMPGSGMPFWTSLNTDMAFYLTGKGGVPESRIFYVDNTPPTTDIQFPSHGYERISDTSGYLKCYTDFTISADDTGPCQAGLEYLLWRYEYNGVSYPLPGDPESITGAYLASHYGYTDPNIINHNWSYSTQNTEHMCFAEECVHTLYYWAKDNVCHNSTMKTHTFYVDNSAPYVDFIPPTHGYYPTDATSGYLKCYTNFTLAATDLPANDCHAGIESIFWRYTYDGDNYPPTQRPIPDPTDSIIYGPDLVTLYGDSYNIHEITDYYWYRYDGSNKIINFTEQCQHELYYFAKDNVCQHSIIYHYTFQVDNTPPTTDIQFPSHGYERISDTSGYLKCYTDFTISAADTGPCQAGLEYLLWRYEYNGVSYPLPGDPESITGAYLASHYGYTDPNIINHNWSYTTQSSTQIYFTEECIHTFYYWAKDNVCNPSIIKTHTFYVDNSAPYVDFIPPTHGYYPIDATSGYLKCFKNFTLAATDLPANDCHAGIESIFWRYEYNGDKYPPTSGPVTDPIVYGPDLVTLYGDSYNIHEITDYYWYRYDGSNKIINFTEQCQHDLYYFAKDNVCQHSIIYHHTFQVDNTPPTTDLTLPTTGYCEINSTDGFIKCYTNFTISADDTGPCQAGLEYLLWRYVYNGKEYPTGPGPDVITGAYLASHYGYTDPNIINHNWSYTTQNTQQIYFTEECVHTFYYWAKDNVCNPSIIKSHVFHVDNTPPIINKTISQPRIYAGQDEYGHDVWWVTTDTQICVSADDCPAVPCPCASDLVTFKYRVWFLGNWTDWIPYPGCFNFSEHCTHYLEINTSDCVGNWILDNETFIVHGEIGEHPTLASPPCGVILIDNTPTLVWNPVLSQEHYRVEWSNDIFFGTFDYANVTGTEYTVPPLPDGTYYWHVAIVYTAGSLGQWSDTCSFTIDTTAPTAPALDINDPDHDGYDTDGDVTLTWTPAVDTGTGVAYYEGEVSMDPTFMTGVSSSGHITELFASFNDVPLDGTWYARVHAVDYANNSGPWSNVESITVDRVLPEVDITSPSMNEFVSGTIIITFTISDLNLDDSTALISTDNGQTWQAPSGGCVGGVCTHSWDTTTETNGLAYGILAKVSDNAGNVGTSEMVIVIVDNNAAESVVVIKPLDGSFVKDTVDFEAIASDSVSGVSYVQFWLDGVLYDTDTVPGTWTSSWATTASDDGVHTLFARAYDNLGNSMDSVPVSFTVDNTPPLAPTVTITDLNGDGYDNDGVVTVMWSPAFETGSGVDYYELLITDSITTYSTKVYGGALSATFSDVPEGTFFVMVRAVDKLGNIGPWSTTTSIIVDTIAPNLVITNPLPDDRLSGFVSIEYYANDFNGITGYEVFIDGGCVYSGTSESYLWDTTTYNDGSHLIKVTATDAAGNTAEQEVLMQVDNTPGSVSIIYPVDGQEFFGPDPGYYVTVTVTAPDNTDYVEFTGDCIPGTVTVNDPEWEYDWMIGGCGEGCKTITATAYDENGDVINSDSVTIHVYIDTTPPTQVELWHMDDGLGDHIYDADGTITMVWSRAYDYESGIHYYELKICDGYNQERFVTVTEGLEHDYLTYTFSDLCDGTYHVKVRAWDYAGNHGDWSNTDTVIVDKHAPDLAIYYPLPDDRLSGTICIEYYADDVNGITGYEVFIDGGCVYSGTNTYYFWDSTTYNDGSHLIKVTATDAAGNTAEQEVLMQVDNTPGSVSIIYPVDGQEFYAPAPDYYVTVTVTAPDNTDYVEFTGDCIPGTVTVNDPEWEYNWVIGGCGDGDKTITATAYDENGDLIGSDSVTIHIYIDNTPPTQVELWHMDDGLGGYEYDADGTITMVWCKAYDDESGIHYYELSICDGENHEHFVTVTEGLEHDYITYTFSDLWDNTYHIKVRAWDYAGNHGDWSNTDTVIVDTHAPVLTITYPPGGTIVDGIVDITFTGYESANPIVIIDGVEHTSSGSPYSWDTTTTYDGVHSIQVEDTDLAGNIGDSRTVMVSVDNIDESDPHIYITDLEPIDGGHMLRVHINAYDDKTSWEDLLGSLRVWIPGGRRDAPTIWSGDEHEEVSAVQLDVTEDYYYADIQIYKYQNGTEITICADVTDEAGNYEPAAPVSYMIESTIVWDQWMQYGWNSLTIPYEGIGASHLVENVLASIDGKYNLVFYYNEVTDDWVSYSTWRVEHGYPNDLTEMDEGKVYWVHMNVTEGARYYTDTGVPELEILNPQNGEELPDGPSDINIYAFDPETEVTEVWVSIYDQTDHLYYGSWQPEEVWHLCDYAGDNEWTFGTEGIWTPCHTYDITSRAYDAAGNMIEDTNTFFITCPEGEASVEMIKQVWKPLEFTDEYVTYLYTIADLVLFSYEDNTLLTIYDSADIEIWSGTINDGQYHNEYVDEGTYKIVGDKKFSVLTGDPISDYVMGFYGMDNNGYGASTKLYTYMPYEYCSDYFIVFAYTDGTEVTITNMDTATIVWSGTLDKGEHYTDTTLMDDFVKIESNYPVSALSYNDQGYFVPSANQKFSGTEFYTFADYLCSWPNTLHVMAYEDDTTVTIKDTDTDTIYWTGTLNAGEEHEITTYSSIYYTILSDKVVTVAVLPVDGYQNGYYYGCYVMDKTGTGIGSEFYIPTLNGGDLWTFAYEDETTVYIYNAATGELMGTYDLNKGEAVEMNQGYGYWRIFSDNPVSVYSGWGGGASAAFAPVLFGEALGGYWAKSRGTPDVEEPVKFRIGIHNTGDCNLEDGYLIDYIPDGMFYYEGSTEVTVITGEGTFVYDGPEVQPTVTINPDGTTTLEWTEDTEEYYLPPNGWVYIEFVTYVTDCHAVLTNLADLTAYPACGNTLNAQDTAEVLMSCGEENNPPYPPYDPTPTDEVTDVDFSDVWISWYVGGDPDTGDQVIYDIYFGTDPDPTYNIGQTAWWPYDYIGPLNTEIGGCAPGTTYYWKIVATDNHGASTPGPIWTFTTGD